MRVPGGFSNDLGGDSWGQPQVYRRAVLMQIICIRDIYPSKTNGKQQVAKIYPHKTQCLRDSTLAKHSVLEAPMSKTHSEITCCKNGSPQNTVIQQLDPHKTRCFRSSNVKKHKVKCMVAISNPCKTRCFRNSTLGNTHYVKSLNADKKYNKTHGCDFEPL